MGYLSREKIEELGLKHVGRDVQISDKACIYNPELISIDDFSRIDDFSILSGNVKIGKYVHITPFCMVAGGKLGVVFEDFSGLAYNVSIFSQSDDYSGKSMTNPLIPKKYKNEYCARVRIGRHVIIGAGSCVMPGVDIADGCSVGAITLVTKSTDPWGIYVGSPAKRVKERSKNLLELEKQFLEEESNDQVADHL